MKTNTSWNKLVIVVALGVALSGIPAFTAVGKAPAADPAAHSEWSGRGMLPTPQAQAGDAVSEWNQQAVTLALLPTSALTSVQQKRVMAIVQVAVQHAVNRITGKYEPYLSPGEVPENTSPEAAAIAAAHHALRSLFNTQAASLDALYAASRTVHRLSEADPGIAFGRSCAAAILALRAGDHSDQAQFDYTAPGAGTP